MLSRPRESRRSRVKAGPGESPSLSRRTPFGGAREIVKKVLGAPPFIRVI